MAANAEGEGGCFDFEVHGKVQGVFFRKFTKEKARELGIVGWVMNTEKGTVLGHAQSSDPAALQQFEEWLREVGSPKSRIDRCDVRNRRCLSELTFATFDVSRTPKTKKKKKKRDEEGDREGREGNSNEENENTKNKDENTKTKKKKKKKDQNSRLEQ